MDHWLAVYRRPTMCRYRTRGLSPARWRRRLRHPACCSPAWHTYEMRADGSAIGKALSYVEIDPLRPGHYGFHLHLVRRHPRDGDMMHGLHHPDGSNNNDPPNLYVAGDWISRAEFYTTPVSLMQERVLLDTDGSAVIIHENPDHHMTQLIGGACGCIACGIINANVTVDASATCCRAEYG